MYEKLSEDAAFWFSSELELLFAAEGILRRSDLSLYKIFGDTEKLRRKYRLASEINASLAEKETGLFMLECIHGFDAENFTLEGFYSHVLAIENLPSVISDRPARSPEDLEDVFKDYLSASSFILRVKEYVSEVFALAEELRSDGFYDTLNKYKSRAEDALEDARVNLKDLSPLQYSDKLLRKVMYNRGPYVFHIFSPSVFMDLRAVRFIKRRSADSKQFLFYSLRDTAKDNEQIYEKFKALGDGIRFKIIAMAKERGHIRGTEIVKLLGLSAATVSYHVRMLRDAGLLHEEQDGASRIYSIPTDAAKALRDGIDSFLGE